MDQDLREDGLLLERVREDRRAAPYRPPPYVTDEGFVLYDRREGGQRQRSPEPASASSTASDQHAPMPVPDLVSQRMQRLAAMYGYVSAQARAQAEVAKEIGSDWYRPVTRKSANGA